MAEAFGSPAEADLVEAIRASPGYRPGLSLVAVDEATDEVVGHVMISEASLRILPEGDRRIVMLAPLAVAPSCQRQGIGGSLVRAVCAQAAHAGEPFVVLEGDPAYYSRFGFEPAARFAITMPLPDWAPAEAAQILVLDPATTPPSGNVVYPEPFDALAD